MAEVVPPLIDGSEFSFGSVKDLILTPAGNRTTPPVTVTPPSPLRLVKSSLTGLLSGFPTKERLPSRLCGQFGTACP